MVGTSKTAKRAASLRAKGIPNAEEVALMAEAVAEALPVHCYRVWRAHDDWSDIDADRLTTTPDGFTFFYLNGEIVAAFAPGMWSHFTRLK